MSQRQHTLITSGTLRKPVTPGTRDLDRSSQQRADVMCHSPSGVFEYQCGQVVPIISALRVAVKPQHIQIPRLPMGPTHHRSLRDRIELPTSEVQQQVCRPRNSWNRRSSATGLGESQQLCQSAISFNSASHATGKQTECVRDNNCPEVAKSAMVSTIDTDGDISSPSSSKNRTHTGHDTNAGGMSKSSVEDIRLENMWEDTLTIQVGRKDQCNN